MTDQPSLFDLEHTSEFVSRHVGVAENGDQQRMLETVGYASLDDLLADAVPASIREKLALPLPPAAPEAEVAAQLRGAVRSRREHRGGRRGDALTWFCAGLARLGGPRRLLAEPPPVCDPGV